MKSFRLIFIVFILFLVTGCLLGEEGKGYLTKTCTLTENFDGIVKSEKIRVTHKDNDITLITMEKIYSKVGNQYVFTSLKDSFISEQDSLKDEIGLEIMKVQETDELLEVHYIFYYDEISDYVKKLYKIEKQYYLQIKSLEEQGYTCG